ncbi:MAG: hypothetical protein Q9159_003759 [Coniocarpon cinnabarinum]
MRTSTFVMPKTAYLPSPLIRRQKSTLKPTDVEILNYALMLEQLQHALYQQGLTNYTKQDFKSAKYASSVYSDFSAILSDEKSHVSYYQSALQKINESSVSECTYDFGTSNVTEFVELASKIEGVVVSAYLGIETFWNATGNLTGSNTIMTVEARHSAFLRYGALAQEPHASPYDIPLDFDSVQTLIKSYILECPLTDAQMPPITDVKSFPMLGYQNYTYPISINDTITLVTKDLVLVPKQNGKTILYAAWATHGSPAYTPATDVDGCGTHFNTAVPKRTAGQSFVFLTACNDTLTDSTILAGPALLEVGD